MHCDISTLKEWLALYFTPSIGVKTYYKLLKLFESPHNILNLSAAQLKQAGVTTKAIRTLDDYHQNKNTSITKMIEKTLTWYEQKNHHIITINNNYYPPLLKFINDPPILLFVVGNLNVLVKHQLAIVGSRHPSIYGINNAKKFTQYFSKQGVVINSGMALGIDSYSHQETINTGGQTVAIIGTGADIIYPPQAKNLAMEIIKNGAIVSEFPLGTLPKGANFPRRNRIISGMSLGTLIIEAAAKSGSLITARLAIEYNREVFAIPGNINNIMSEGGNNLIRNSLAKLVTRPEDIIEELETLAQCQSQILEQNKTNDNNLYEQNVSNRNLAEQNISPSHKNILDIIAQQTLHIDQIVQCTALNVDQVQELLIEMELNSYIIKTVNGFKII